MTATHTAHAHDAKRKPYRDAAQLAKPRLHHVPQWLRLRLFAAVRSARATAKANPPGLADHIRALASVDVYYSAFADAMLRSVFAAFDVESVLDHWGSLTRPDGRRSLVGEPYGLPNADAVGRLKAVAAALGCELSIQEHGWWNPPATCRIEFIEGHAAGGNA
jgi:hypothetical protein